MLALLFAVTSYAAPTSFFTLCTDPAAPIERREVISVMLHRVGVSDDLNVENCHAGEELLQAKGSINLFRYEDDPFWPRLSDIKPLAAFSQWQSVTLTDNDFSDLPLGTALRQLNMTRNRVTDLTGLVRLPNLEVLLLSGNGVSDAGAVTALARLRELDLSDNALADADFVTELPLLKVLNIARNQIRQLPMGLPPRLEYLQVADNLLTVLPAVGEFATYIDAENNQLTGLAVMPTGLKTLDVSGNQLQSVAVSISHCENLRWLDVRGNPLQTLAGLGGLISLEHLYFSGDLAVPADLQKLTSPHYDSAGQLVSLRIHREP
jgi:Leucine-rich repeat (LRR) protein